MRLVFIYGVIGLLGLVVGWLILDPVRVVKNPGGGISLSTARFVPESIGFMPYWLIDKADKDYSHYLTEMTYFALTVNSDGTIQEYVNPGEAEPGWYALRSGKFVPSANLVNSLAVFSGNPEVINELIGDPINHAAALAEAVGPIMDEFGFSKLNVDLESVLPASESARQNMTTFIKTLKNNLDKPLTIDASPTDLIKFRLIDLKAVEPYVEKIILMTYDYHYSGSMVTGPVAPNGGAGVISEFDVETGIQEALEIVPPEKIVLGVPLYGYEWETLLPNNRAAVLPGSGIVASNRRVEEFLAGCASCSAQREDSAQEAYVVYLDQETKTYHQIFYPEEKFMAGKIKLAEKYQLSGLAYWAIGYEGSSLLNPVAAYLK